MTSLPRIKTLYLYTDPSSPSLQGTEIKEYLHEILPCIPVSLRKDFFTVHPGDPETLPQLLAGLKVRNPLRPHEDHVPLPGEIAFEKTLLQHPDKPLVGILYDGPKLDSLLRNLLPPTETHMKFLHIVFTSRLIGTYDSSNKRYHARAILFGYPTIISTSGLIEAPAKPREYYLQRMNTPSLVLKERFQGKCLGYDDSRLTQVVKGYVMQAVLYHLTQDPFCSHKTCRLFDAHWQEDLLKAQLTDPDFCAAHTRLLQGYCTQDSPRGDLG